jgi:hypothetical protein
MLTLEKSNSKKKERLISVHIKTLVALMKVLEVY